MSKSRYAALRQISIILLVLFAVAHLPRTVRADDAVAQSLGAKIAKQDAIIAGVEKDIQKTLKTIDDTPLKNEVEAAKTTRDKQAVVDKRIRSLEEANKRMNNLGLAPADSYYTFRGNLMKLVVQYGRLRMAASERAKTGKALEAEIQSTRKTLNDPKLEAKLKGVTDPVKQAQIIGDYLKASIVVDPAGIEDYVVEIDGAKLELLKKLLELQAKLQRRRNATGEAYQKVSGKPYKKAADSAAAALLGGAAACGLDRVTVNQVETSTTKKSSSIAPLIGLQHAALPGVTLHQSQMQIAVLTDKQGKPAGEREAQGHFQLNLANSQGTPLGGDQVGITSGEIDYEAAAPAETASDRLGAALLRVDYATPAIARDLAQRVIRMNLAFDPSKVQDMAKLEKLIADHAAVSVQQGIDEAVAAISARAYVLAQRGLITDKTLYDDLFDLADPELKEAFTNALVGAVLTALRALPSSPADFTRLEAQGMVDGVSAALLELEVLDDDEDAIKNEIATRAGQLMDLGVGERLANLAATVQVLSDPDFYSSDNYTPDPNLYDALLDLEDNAPLSDAFYSELDTYLGVKPQTADASSATSGDDSASDVSAEEQASVLAALFLINNYFLIEDYVDLVVAVFSCVDTVLSSTPPFVGFLSSPAVVKADAQCHETATDDPLKARGRINLRLTPVTIGGAYDGEQGSEAELKSGWAVNALKYLGVEVDPGTAELTRLDPYENHAYGFIEYPDFNMAGCAGDLDASDSGLNWDLRTNWFTQPAVIDGPQLAVAARPADPVQVAAVADQALPNDFYFHSKGSISEGLDDQWALKRIGFEAVGRDGKGSLWPEKATPVLVAVVDTGVDPSHPELAGSLWANPDEVPGNGKDDDQNGFVDDVLGWNFVDDSNNTWDNNGHGTFVAGIIAARSDDSIGIAGVNPWARILPVKIADFDHLSDNFTGAEGIHYAAKMGARVINVSVGGQGLTGAERFAIEYAIHQGALVVVAAGNDGTDVSGFSPAGIPGVITVASTGYDDDRQGFSNFGAGVDIAAPGLDVLSLRARQTDSLLFADDNYVAGANIIGDDELYYTMSGTSFSAPFVTGVASLLFSINPTLTPEQVKRMILQSARDIDEPGVDWYSGYGLLDAAAAVKADPEFHVDASIADVSLVEQNGQNFLMPTGLASADQLKRAWVEVGQGKAPQQWVKATGNLTQPVIDGPLGLVPVEVFTAGGTWTLRLMVEHANGRTREARFELALE